MSLAQYTDSPYAGSEGKVLLADRAYLAEINTAAPAARLDGALPGSTEATIAASTGAARATNVTTITTSAAHGFAVGQLVVISGVTDTTFNGTRIIATAPTTTTFTVSDPGEDATSGGGKAKASAWFDQGSIDQSLVNLEKADSDIQDYATGLFEVLQDQIAKKEGASTAKYTIVEYDVDAWHRFSGDVPVAVTGGRFTFVGGRPLLYKAVLFVGQNPNTKTEFQHYNPKSTVRWRVVDVNRFRGIEVTVTLTKFTDATDPASLSRDYKLYEFKKPA